MNAGHARTRTREAPDVRRAQLLDAARNLVVERGVRATTMAAVADAAGVAKGTTYLYFASKDDLVDALRAEYLADFAGALRADSTAPPVERLGHFVDGMFRFAAEHQVLHHALIHDAGTSESDAMAGAHEILEPIVATGALDGSFNVDPDRAHTTTTFLLQGIHGVVVKTLHGDGRDGHHEIDDIDEGAIGVGVTQVTEIVLRVVGVAPS